MSGAEFFRGTTMTFKLGFSGLALVAALAAAPAAQAQSKLNLVALKGLAPFSVLLNTEAGKAALDANYKVTGAIQTGTDGQPGLEPFADQQEQALRDAGITFLNAAELADGLGSSLGGAYQKLAVYKSADDKAPTSVGPAVAKLIAYTATLTAADSNAGKYFFADAMYKTGKTPAVPVSAEALAILKAAGGTTDVFGKEYGDPAGTGPKPDKYGDARPFQTLKTVTIYQGTDYFGAKLSNDAYLEGPAQDIRDSPAFPSGHTTYGYTESVLLAILVPERYTQMITRGAEYGNSRIVLGAHYAMDVIGGRTLAYYDIAQLLAEKPAYLNQKEGKAEPIGDYRAAVKAAKAELDQALAGDFGGADSSRFSDAAADEAFYESTQTYGLPAVYPAKVEDVGKDAPEAGWLLKAAFPKLSLAEADKILTATEGPGGGFLDDGKSAFGVYSRLDLYKAGKLAAKE
jgi:hypothetical protein